LLRLTITDTFILDKKRLLELLTKRASGIISLPEARELNDYLNVNQQEKDLSQLLDHVFHGHFKIDNPYTSEEVQQQFKKIKAGIDVPETAVPIQKKIFSKRRVFVFVRAVAALFLLSLGIWYYFAKYQGADPASKNIIATKKGSKSNLVLPDGTKVWLNADSRLSYDQSFGSTVRGVELEGEAYFDVVKDKDRPFIVHTKLMDIKVLGTAFNVRAYKDEPTNEATLIRGLVEVNLKRKGSEHIVLKPNEKIVIRDQDDTKSQEVVTDNINSQVPVISVLPVKLNFADSTVTETQWTKNKLVFDLSYLEDIIPELERWYGVSVSVKDSSILKRKMSGSYENESLTEVMESFRLAMGIRYTIAGNHLDLYK